MNSFCLFEKQKKIEVVKLGFSWKAFLFTFFWGITNELWLYSLSWYCSTLFLIISFFYMMVDSFFLLIYLILTSCFWGFFGNQLLIINLTENKGFQLKKIISSSSIKEAIFFYLIEKK